MTIINHEESINKENSKRQLEINLLLLSMYKFTILLLSTFIGFILANNCNSATQCVAQQKQAIQSACGGVSQSESCLCQQYQSMIASCLSNCSDPTSMQLMQSIQSDSSSYCSGAMANPMANSMPFNNNFLATPIIGGSQSSLIINDGPTGIAIPVQTNAFGNQGFGNQATVSLSNTPIKISSAYDLQPRYLILVSLALSLAFVF
ncbi:hypothetical protein K502DRAFT_353603 [Neoconidiobolus thromboides FSU 785]|nr:hypothetical protein K502DRAFT_353603 [Neoconidiobolus thromboides FSU 785]